MFSGAPAPPTRPREIVMVSPYPGNPEIWNGSSFAVAAYTHALADHLLQHDPGLRITVLGDLRDRADRNSASGTLIIRRVWSPRKVGSFLRLWWAIRTSRGRDVLVVVQFEMAMFGGPLYGLLFVILLGCLRLSRRRTVLVLHNLVTHSAAVRGQLDLPAWSPLPFLYASALWIWRRLLNTLVSESIVLEPTMVSRLRRGRFNRPVSVIPHGVQSGASRNADGGSTRPFQLLLFGFPGWYKGTDLAVQWFGDAEFRAALPSPSRLLVAGSPNPLHSSEDRYRKYLRALARLCEEVGAVYRPEVDSDDIAELFASADLVVMPYRVLVGGSGVFSLAFEHGAPFALSAAVRPWLEAPDIAEALRDTDLTADDFVFQDAAGLAAIATRSAEPDRRASIRKLAARVATERAWTSIARSYHTVLFGG